MWKSRTKYCQHPKKKIFVFLLLILGISVLKTEVQDIGKVLDVYDQVLLMVVR
jgi:hypothetical protein